ncbi:MAG TPA: response regulator [Desulfohalobiaceae bacterium]|nr:response regulator [Desulfohalobiaceae bacterium]
MSQPFVLLVDDEQPFIDTMTKRLSKRNLKVLSALNGQAALEILDKNRNLDVVILDVKMPGMDGVETLQEIKKSYPLIEVVMLTGHATVESAVEGMKLGAFDYLMKPCDIDELLQKVNQATEKKRAHVEKIKEAAVKNALSSYVE